MATPRPPTRTAASTNMITSSRGTGIVSLVGPPNHWITKNPMNAPTMYRSPCAKLSSFSTPYTIEKPSATSEKSAPVVTPFTSSWKKKLMGAHPAHHAGCPARQPVADAPGQLPQLSRSGTGDQLVGAARVDLEQEELAVEHIPVRVEADRLPENGGRLVGGLDRRQHVGAVRRMTGRADRRDRLVDHVRGRERRRAER